MEEPEAVGNPDVIHYLLHTNSTDTSSQRDNLFHSRCEIDDYICKIVIDNSSCANIASVALEERLQLPRREHPKPYTLHWLDDSNTISVTHQAWVSLSIGVFSEALWCDIVPMTACQVLFGRSWQHDWKVSHNAKDNTYLVPQGKLIIELLPLPPPDSSTARSSTVESVSPQPLETPVSPTVVKPGQL